MSDAWSGTAMKADSMLDSERTGRNLAYACIQIARDGFAKEEWLRAEGKHWEADKLMGETIDGIMRACVGTLKAMQEHLDELQRLLFELHPLYPPLIIKKEGQL